MITIVYAHPLEEGMNAATRNALVEHLRAANQPYNLINLYQEGFNPVMTMEERSSFFACAGESTDPLVQKYQKMLRAADHLVFMFPVWFNEQPAFVKGFFERVCLPGFGYTYTGTGTAPLLTHIKRLTVITSSGAPTEMLTAVYDNMIELQFIGHVVRIMIGTLTDEDASAWINLGPALPKNLGAHIAAVKARFSR
ncbi:MAG: NAD(P)H-dependent oxidoreductase [Oscillospiraceae bacterium]|jgi:putative NADPH-quinone reductase|nr:NAD(P)H-dependent oxidoreductase [Oscillospiraceae bacterium]